MGIRVFLLGHPSLPLWVMVACLALIVAAWVVQSPYWWLIGWVLAPVAMVAWVAWRILRRATRKLSN
jgi:hypothetical protein